MTIRLALACWCGAAVSAPDSPACADHDRRTPPEERALYDGQPFAGLLTGVPADAGRPCGWRQCRGMLRPVPGTQHFDADGHAMVDANCDTCHVQSSHYWYWTDKPPAEDDTRDCCRTCQREIELTVVRGADSVTTAWVDDPGDLGSACDGDPSGHHQPEQD